MESFDWLEDFGARLIGGAYGESVDKKSVKVIEAYYAEPDDIIPTRFKFGWKNKMTGKNMVSLWEEKARKILWCKDAKQGENEYWHLVLK